MKTRFLMAVIPVLGLGSLLIAQDDPFAPPAFPASSQPASPPTSRPARPPMSLDTPPNLERAMKMMDRQMKTITQQIDDKTKDASTLAAVNTLQVYTTLAKSALPDSIGELTGDAKQRAVVDYRERIIAVIRTQLLLEEAILRDDRAAAREAIAKLREHEKDGHSAFGVDGDQH